MTTYHVLSLGAGVQSTTLYLMFREQLITPQIDCAIFADTGEEPAPVYQHLDWLRSLNGPPIHTCTAGRLGDDLINGRNSTGHRFASIPAFTTDGQGSRGITKRQCSKEYKVEVIDRFIRRDLAKCPPGRAIPRNYAVHQYIGISLDEQARAIRIAKNATRRRWHVHFPLIESKLTRRECIEYLSTRVPHQTPRSSCVCCPYRSDAEWAHLQQTDPAGYARAIEIDRALRTTGAVANRDMKQSMYLHSSRQPLELVQLDPKPVAPRWVQLSMGLNSECEGVCGV